MEGVPTSNKLKTVLGKLMGNVAKYPSSVWFILGNELCERFAYYGMRTILVVYFVEFIGFNVPDSVSYYHLFITMCYMAPLLGGYISDAYIGKYRTILILSSVYCAGLAILSVTAVPGITGTPPHWWGVFVGLLLVALGTGGIKPCVSSFGGDQFQNHHDNSDEAVSGYFHIFYMCINIGSLISTISTPLLRSYVSFEVAFMVPAILMGFAVLAFWLGRHRYHQVPPQGSPVGLVMGVITTAMGQWFRVRKRGKGTDDGGDIDMLSTENVASDEPRGLLDRARIKYSARDVSDTRAVISALKIFIPLPIFWSLYDQQGSRWVLQARDMYRTMGSFTMPEEQMQAVNALLIILLIPVYERVLYPFLRRIGIPMTQLRRLATGMVLTAIAFIAAAVLQLFMDSAGVGKVNVWWQVPQYVILTCGSRVDEKVRVFTKVRNLCSVIMAFFLLTTALGDIIVSVTAQISIFNSNFMFFAGLMLAFTVVFSLIARTVVEKPQLSGYENIDEPDPKVEVTQTTSLQQDVTRRERMGSDTPDLAISIH